MTMHTWGVGLSVTPTVIGRTVDHYANRKKRKQKPTAHISYDVALGLIRKFLTYASKHTVEDVQGFTAQWVPTPTWVHTEQLKIPEEIIEKAAAALVEQLGPAGVEQIGGKTWWKWRREGATDLKADWIEMKADRKRRIKTKEGDNRVMFYIHGGAYFFGSVDEHRYQLQRHARKLKARVFAPRYRLAPQFPFPCGLLDCLAAYLHLLTTQDPTTIVLAGDSAGGGMAVSLLVILRDQGLPIPAGAILISPWVDLTHSFPSVAADNEFDYIPPYGFMQKPSMCWPPPNSDDMKALKEAKATGKNVDAVIKQGQDKSDAKADAQGIVVKDEAGTSKTANTTSIPSADLSLVIDRKTVQLRDQIQMYATNEQLSNPLVSPVLQPSLGGLPPLLVVVGGGEMLRDEQIYLAHKAANPTKYPPGDAYLDKTPGAREKIGKYKPTLVQLQVWDDLCHVAPTLSFTRPAKYMYRSIAQFGAWALAQAQRTDIDIIDDDAVSVISSASSSSDDEERRSRKEKEKAEEGNVPTDKIGKAGDDIPHFKNHMVRQRVDRNGNVYRLAPENQLPALQLTPDLVGVIKPGPVRKWMDAKSQWDTKYARQKRKVQKQRLREMQKGYLEFKEGGVTETPPPSALASRRGLPGSKAPKVRKSLGLSFWSMMGSKHDEDAVDREEKLDRDAEAKVTVTQPDGTTTLETAGGQKSAEKPRSGSHRRTISYQGAVDENTTAAELEVERQEHSGAAGTGVLGATSGAATAGSEADRRKEAAAAAGIVGVTGGAAAAATAATASKKSTADASVMADAGMLSPTFVPLSKLKQAEAPLPAVHPADAQKDPLVLEGTNVTLASPEATRPKADGVAFPFKLNSSLDQRARNASTVTLESSLGIRPDTPATPNTPKDESKQIELGGQNRGPSSPIANSVLLQELDADATPKAKKVAAPVVAGAAAGGALIAAGATSLATAGRATTSSTIDTVSTPGVDHDTEHVTTPPLVAGSTAFSTGLTLFPDDGPSTSGPVRTETPSVEKELAGIINGPVRTETPAIEKALGGGSSSGGGTPKGGADSAGWATPRAGSISTAAPSEAGDLARFETADED